MASGREAIAAIGRHPGAQRLTIAAGVVAALVMPFAIVTLTRLVSRRAPALGAAGGVLAIAGWAMIPVLVTIDVLRYELAKAANPAGGGSRMNQMLAPSQAGDDNTLERLMRTEPRSRRRLASIGISRPVGISRAPIGVIEPRTSPITPIRARESRRPSEQF